MDKRYAPETVMTLDHGMMPVKRYILHPPGHDCTAIKRESSCLECVTDAGSRFYGVDGGEINSELRMVVWGGFVNPRNELARSWKKCSER